MKKIECVILDWAGTAVDYGCFAPVSAFIESFRTLGLEVTGIGFHRKLPYIGTRSECGRDPRPHGIDQD